MRPFASDYFLALSQVCIGFVAFSTIAVVLREVVRAPFDAYQTLLVRFVIECGLAATFYALLPELLALTGLTPPLLWRVASAALGVFGVVAPFHYVHRRHRAKPGPLPARAVWITLLTIVVDAVLWLNVLTPVFGWSVGPYAVGVTWLVVQAGVILVLAFGEFLRKGNRRSEPLPSLRTVRGDGSPSAHARLEERQHLGLVAPQRRSVRATFLPHRLRKRR
jgi:hypothetical protein